MSSLLVWLKLTHIKYVLVLGRRKYGKLKIHLEFENFDSTYIRPIKMIQLS